MSTADPLPAIRAALTTRDLADPDDPDLPDTCARIREVAVGGDVDAVAEHLDRVEQLGAARSDAVQEAAAAIVAAVRREGAT